MIYTKAVVLVPCGRVRAWAFTLADALRTNLTLPVTILRAADAGLDGAGMPAEKFESWLFPSSRCGHAVWVATLGVPSASGVSLDGAIIIDATGSVSSYLSALPPTSAILAPRYHGSPSMSGLLGPLIEGEAPHIGVITVGNGGSKLIEGVHIALPDRSVIMRVLDAALARMITLICRAASHLVSGTRLPDAAALPLPSSPPRSMNVWRRQFLPGLIGKAGRALSRRLIREEDFCIAVREATSPSDPAQIDLAPETFQRIEAPFARFYADPFLFVHDRSLFLFFEDYDYATGLGRISCVALAGLSAGTEVTPVLTRDYHLSYPFVFENNGSVLMIPETSGNQTIELYEAVAFPHEWRLRTILMDGIEAADVTLHQDDVTGSWWMFATVTEYGSSSYDTLSIFHAEKVEGPWHPHKLNPVKVDPLSSRPAGPLVSFEGRLLRPAQDCTRGYGSGLVWCEILTLTTDSFKERIVAHHLPPPGFTGLHTFCRAGGYEAIDLKRRRWRAGMFEPRTPTVWVSSPGLHQGA